MDLFKQQSSYTKNQNFCEVDFKPDKKYLKRKLNKKSRKNLKKLLTKQLNRCIINVVKEVV